MDNVLRTFFNNKTQRETVKVFMVEVLKELAVEKTFARESVEGIADAKECVEAVFDRLEEKYGKIEEPVISNSR